MSHKRLAVAATIIALVVLVGFFFSAPRVRDGEMLAEEVSAISTPSVALHDVFRKGVHTISGTLEAPDACSSVSAEATAAGDAAQPSGIVVAVTLTQSEGVCLQLPTRMTFSATLTAPADLPLTATVNGATATTTIQ